MDKKQKLKIIGYGVFILLVLNLVLFAMQMITQIMFWIVIVVGAWFVYYGLPKLKKKL
ncbi:hypothetical protein HOD05_05700 [Candidatus Woesearchaeota archaeon]|jgi:uncharacterized membrane protein|nr:hypothetical protein [Candidatus Woesearchaeota archaeon]MBT4150742.1 hypothetical protein [Candidatus Woesearchaeota archaeon]MBT4247710.1 hypothetical protein [Candidatus Woesearchaeota archaeon]MBT4434674.1 hypothetical protein [Candidatus Woesearchaeota archaeon]MBT5215856.1 hypothetical protein [Candidatus Woesearchaeota archaeon]